MVPLRQRSVERAVAKPRAATELMVCVFVPRLHRPSRPSLGRSVRDSTTTGALAACYPSL